MTAPTAIPSLPSLPSSNAILRLFLEVIDSYATLSEKIGQAETKYKVRFDPNLFGQTQVMMEMIRKSKVQDLGTMFKFFADISVLNEQINNIIKLTPKEKLELAKRLHAVVAKYS